VVAGLRGLTHFSGRTGRAPFWLYVLVIFLVTQAFYTVAFGALMATAIAQAQNGVQSLAAGPPALFLPLTAFIALLLIAALAAVVVRRLHDTGRTGWWAAMPLPFLFAGFPLMHHLFSITTHEGGLPPDFRLFVALFANNTIYLLLLTVLIVLLAQKGQAGDNRFGPPPS
jgi:uncharacterized membrane protein YhaH (DUF805 family)